MPITTKHASYREKMEHWRRLRDLIEGEAAVKAAGEEYLPRLSDQDDAEYEAYKARAMFYNATARTLRGLVGMVTRKPPAFDAPDALIDDLHNGRMTSDGKTIEALTADMVEEILAVGRCGLLVDANREDDASTTGIRANIAMYQAEDIINWRMATIDGDDVTTLVVLREAGRISATNDDEFETQIFTDYRVLRLEVGDGRAKPVYTQQMYLEVKSDAKGDGESQWEPQEVIVPRVRGKSMDRIPFIFVNVSNLDAMPQMSPLIHLANVNVSHYRTSADLEHGQHFTALPTAWISGIDDATQRTKWKIGSAVAWTFADPDAKAGYLEFTGAGLSALESSMSKKEKLMAVLGARLLEEQQPDIEAADTIKLRQSGDHSALSVISHTVSRAVTAAVRLRLAWTDPTAKAETVSVEVNRDFNTANLTPQQIESLTAAWVAGAISWDVLYFNFRRGEVYPENHTMEDERQLIENMTLDGGVRDDMDGDEG